MPEEKGTLDFIRVAHGRIERVSGAIIGETKWTLFVNRREVVSFMCTPSKLHYLALGFMRSENIIQALDDVVARTYAWNPRKRQFTARQIGIAMNVLSRKGWLKPFKGQSAE